MSCKQRQSRGKFVGAALAATSPGTPSPSLAFIKSNFAAKAAPTRCRVSAIWSAILMLNSFTFGQTEPGDTMIHAYLSQQASELHGNFLSGIQSKQDWLDQKPRFKEEYLYMLGLSPMPEKTDLKATVTGTLEGEGYTVEKLHYQSSPGLYVTANLYRPAKVEPGEKLPAILYVCGHAQRGRNGNKAAYQSHGIWFARHGYVCLMVDTVQRGEISGVHHGTYSHNRWWWLSRGYTPAGVECWNGIRGIDYLISRPDVDAERIGVTGISGGGAVTFWVAAADERVKVAIPVSGMADLPSYLGDHIIDEHCDCMFMNNTYQWPWTRIAALIAPRPLMFVNSDNDAIFPMNANERVSNRLETFYSLFGAGDQVETLVSIGGHAYREDIRKATFRFMNIHLKNDPSPITDSEVDIVTGNRDHEVHPIAPELLRVFPTNEDIPKDEISSTIDEHFVPLAKFEGPKPRYYDRWKEDLISKLRAVSFRSFLEQIPVARLLETNSKGAMKLETESGIFVGLKVIHSTENPKQIVLQVNLDASQNSIIQKQSPPNSTVYQLNPRGTGDTKWTIRNPPNYVARSHLLIGRTVGDGRIWDIMATARYLKQLHGEKIPIFVSGEKAGAVLAAYASLLEPEIGGAILVEPILSHMDENCPALLNVLRVCDVPDVLGALAPKRLYLKEADEAATNKIRIIYNKAEVPNHVRFSF
ncbi:MAG: prolyl oligopeptidase family serine peptidase [Verrucomicrobia bacterium]|nr:prolyl oligopeptidase family serine peptidase [Verrucomicrobiota bacterium]